MVHRWTRRIVRAVIVLAVSLVLAGGIGAGVLVYSYAHHFDGDKAAMQALIAHNLQPGASPATVERFLHAWAFAAFEHAHRFDAVYVDARPGPVATYVYYYGPLNHAVPPATTILAVELDRSMDDVKMTLALLFDSQGRYVSASIDEWGPTM